MPVHPLWRPFEQVSIEDLKKARIDGGAEMHSSVRIDMCPPNPEWPHRYDELAATIRTAIGDKAVAIQHVGSTSVRGLWAKPIIDVDLTVTDSSDEERYVPDLTKVGFIHILREPDWEEHRLLVMDDPQCNLHVFSVGTIEPQRHLLFRNWLLTHPDDRDRYATLKRDLASREWETTMGYNNAKGKLIYEIYERIFVADARHRHTPISIVQTDEPRGCG
jgi:GrpB-like predicted nucleotidyltransferase (UPF0157 family)